MKMRISQLAQSGATDQQVATFDLATGFWMPKTPAAGSAHVVQDEGVAVTQRGTLNFAGAGVTVTDDAVNAKTLVTIPGGGGGGSAWTLAVDLPLTSLTNWTAEGGTWTAEVDRIRQSDTSATGERLRYTALVLPAEFVLQVDLRTNVGTGENRVGVTLGQDVAGGNGGHVVFLRGDGTNLTNLYFENEGLTNNGTVALPANVAYGTYATLRVHYVSGDLHVIVDGTPVTTSRRVGNGGLRPRFALMSYATDCSFRNLKVWTPTLP